MLSAGVAAGKPDFFAATGETLSFGAVASEFQSGTLSELVRLDENRGRSYDFEIVVLGASGNTGLQIEVEGAKMDGEGFTQSMGDFATMQAGLSFSMSARLLIPDSLTRPG